MSDRWPRVPLIFRMLDAIGIIGILLATTIFLTGGFREWTPFGRLSMTSWIRPLVISLGILGLRHWWLPRPTLYTTVRSALHVARTAVGVREALPIVFSTRAGVLLVGFLGIALVGYRADLPVPWRIYQNEIMNLPARWDTGWYLGVAIDGYSWHPSRATQQQNIAFFPVYPMLMRYGSLLLGREVMWTGVLISWLSFFGAMVYLFRFARSRLGDDVAVCGITLLACYPFAIFFSVAYTEALFLLTIVAACYHFERDQLWQAGIWGLVAGLTRPNGCLLSVVLGLLAIRPLWVGGSWRPTWPPPMGWPRLADRLAAAAAPGVGMLIFSTYIFFLTGNPLQWAIQNAAWGRVYRGLDDLVSQQANTIGEHGLYQYAATRTIDALQLVAVLFVLATVVPVYRRLGLPYAALILVNLGPPLMMGGLLSMGRVTSVLFPTFLWLAAAVGPGQRYVWVAGFAMLQALCAILFFTWRPLY